MIISFVNLISWSYFRRRPDGHAVFLDSISIRFMAYVFGFGRASLVKKSGVEFFNEHKDRLGKCVFLGPPNLRVVNQEQKLIVLPYWENENDISIDAYLSEISRFPKIIIGVSSPKQEIIASQIQLALPSSPEIICLGAAVNSPNSSIAVRLRCNWLLMFFRNPARGAVKIKATVKEILRLLLSAQRREEFKDFLTWASNHSSH